MSSPDLWLLWYMAPKTLNLLSSWSSVIQRSNIDIHTLTPTAGTTDTGAPVIHASTPVAVTQTCKQTCTQRAPSLREIIEIKLRSTGRIVLIWCGAWPDKYTDQWPAYNQWASHSLTPLLPCLPLPKLPEALPFPHLFPSPKYFIISPVQSQHPVSHHESHTLLHRNPSVWKVTGTTIPLTHLDVFHRPDRVAHGPPVTALGGVGQGLPFSIWVVGVTLPSTGPLRSSVCGDKSFIR